MLGDPELKKCKVGDIIQLQRRGFFRVDNAYAPPSAHTGKASPVVLFEIPDGSQKQTAPAPAAASKTTSVPSGSSSSANDLSAKIAKQGELVRDLKSKKAEKSKVDAEVKVLLALKADFKAQTGKDWTPNAAVSAPVKAETSAPSNDVNDKITKQGNLIRDLKTQKADKAKIDAEVKVLLALKAEYKAQTGKDWLPGAIAPEVKPIAVATQAQAGGDIVEKITKQGDLVRDLKTKKAAKSQIDAEVKTLLALKAEYKAQTGQDYKPGAVAPAPAKAPAASASSSDDIVGKIVVQGDLVRDLKTKKADKSQIDAEVKKLLALKAEYKAQTGQDYKPGAAPVPTPTSQPAAQAPANDSNKITELNEKITTQGNTVRDLKTQKADKSKVDAEVKTLLALKAEFKTLTGNDWKPGTAAVTPNSVSFA